jgi:cold shock CspA family protein
VQRIYPERSFGFIRCRESLAPGDINQDFFFHASGLDDCAISDLEEGGLVEFEPRTVAKGRRAEHIQRVVP